MFNMLGARRQQDLGASVASHSSTPLSLCNKTSTIVALHSGIAAKLLHNFQKQQGLL